VTVHVRSEHARGAATARRLRERACRYLAALGREDAEVSILVVGDAAVRRLNRTWRGEDRATDVLSFPLAEPAKGPAGLAGSTSRRGSSTKGPRAGKGAHPAHALLGDIVISLDTATRVARRDGRAVGAELDRYLAHGLLHLVGYDHQRTEDASLMAAKENALVGEGMLTGVRPGRRRSDVSLPSPHAVRGARRGAGAGSTSG
jgi:probable rRNA maturation factor